MQAIQPWLLALLSVPLAAGFLFPIVARWLPPSPFAYRVALTFGLSLGAWTLLLAVLGFWGISAGRLAILLAVLWALGLSVNRWRRPSKLALRAALRRLLAMPAVGWAGIALLAVVTAQATYYPFTGDDEISRYGWFAKLIVSDGRLTSAVRGYPMLLPLSYATTFFMSGAYPEQAARLFPVLFAVMTVLGAFVLAERWFGRRAAWVTAFVLMSTPLYLRWAAVGYLDIPSALYFVLGAYAIDRWHVRSGSRWAFLSGILTGLALWTKQAGFAMLPALGVIWLARLVTDIRNPDTGHARRTVWHGAAMLLALLMTGGWWYLRNARYDGWEGAVPGPGSFYTQLATHSPTLLAPFIGYFKEFGYLTAPLYILGLAAGALAVVRRSSSSASAASSLLWCLPYTLLWWWSFSYDPRFMLTVLPFFAVLAGRVVDRAACALESRRSLQGLLAPQRRARVALGFVIVFTAAALGQARLGGIVQWITAPTASYAARLTRAKGDLYPTVEFLRERTQPRDRVLSMDARLGYYLFARPIQFGYPADSRTLQDYDYLVYGSWAPSVYARLGFPFDQLRADLDNPDLFQQVFNGPDNSLVVYRVSRP